MQNLKQFGKIAYGLGIAGIGSLQFIYPGFRPVLLPLPPEATQNLTAIVYLTGFAIVLAGIFIAFGKQVKPVALLLGAGLLLFVIFGHLPSRISYNPSSLGMWTDAVKLLALAGGAFMVAHIFPANHAFGLLKWLDKISPYGQYFFALLLVLFGIDHFLYLDFVKTLVPAWIPGAVFWTYFAGVALIGAGLAIFINFKARHISLLLSLMLILWLILLHIPRAMTAPATDNGNEWTSVFECLAFAGMALLWPKSKLND